VSGLNFPVGRLGVLGSVAISILPLAVGLDAMRQLAFADSAYPAGTPGPAAEALILVGMVVVFLLLARWTLVALERRARQEGRLSVRWQ
jgi:ABC-2 type transport system permease protein